MFFQIIIFILLTAAGFLICRQFLKIPGLSMKKNLKHLQTEKEKPGKRLLNRFIMPIARLVSRFIPIDPVKEARMASMLRRGGLELTPKEYYARAILCASLTSDGGSQSRKYAVKSKRRPDDRLAHRGTHRGRRRCSVHDPLPKLHHDHLEQHRIQDHRPFKLMSTPKSKYTAAGGAKPMNSRHRGIRGKFSPPMSIQKLLSERKGSSYFDLMIKTLVVITLMVTVMSFLSIFTTYLNLNHICRRVVRVVELDGQVSNQAYDVFYKLKQQTGLSPEMTVEDVDYCEDQKIQLRDTFTITMTYSYPFTVFTPSFAPPVVIQIPMKASITGMSEHYWKLPE